MSRTRWVALLIAALAAGAVLSACGSSDSDSTSANDKEGSGSTADLASFEKTVTEFQRPISAWPAEAPTEPIKKVEPNKLIVNIALSPEEAGGLAVAEGVVEGAEAIGWRSKILYGYGQASKTNAAFEQAIALGADVVTTQGIDPKTYKGAIKKLHDSGAILVTCCADTPPSAELAQAEINAHSAQTGELAASKAIVDSGGEGTFALFNYPEYTVLNNRLGQAQKTFEECSGCELLSTVDTNPAEAEKTLPSATSTLLQQNPDLTGVVNGIDNMVTNFQLPILRQQQSEAGVYTFLGGGPTLEAVEKGEVTAVVVEPLMWVGWAVVDASARLMAGQKADGQGVPLYIIDQDNVKEALSTAASNGFYDANGFDYRGEFEKLWGLK
jgi:ribose transport system substrate-binding protein